MSSIRVTTPQAPTTSPSRTGLLRTLYPRLRKLNAGKPPTDLRRHLARDLGPLARALPRQLPCRRPTRRPLPPRRRTPQAPRPGRSPSPNSSSTPAPTATPSCSPSGAASSATSPASSPPSTCAASATSASPPPSSPRSTPPSAAKPASTSLAGKNLIGSFHHPLAVFSDIDTLGTLPAAELRAGLQEAIKAASSTTRSYSAI